MCQVCSSYTNNNADILLHKTDDKYMTELLVIFLFFI